MSWTHSWMPTGHICLAQFSQVKDAWPPRTLDESRRDDAGRSPNVSHPSS